MHDDEVRTIGWVPQEDLPLLYAVYAARVELLDGLSSAEMAGMLATAKTHATADEMLDVSLWMTGVLLRRLDLLEPGSACALLKQLEAQADRPRRHGAHSARVTPLRTVEA